MASPRPPAPSSRVVLAFFVAGIIGGLIFLILWVTGRQGATPGRLRSASASQRAEPGAAPAAAAANDITIPRGSVLRGAVDSDEAAEIISLLTQATLVRVNRSRDQLEPWLAESWSAAAPAGASADKTTNNVTYTLKLRPNIVWSDGAPFTADDAVFAIGASSSARVLGKPLTARARSLLEVELTFPGSFAPGLRLLDRVPIVSRRKSNERPGVGLGPFVLHGTSPLVFERNSHYWRTAPDGKALPYLNRLELDTANAPNAALQRLLNGELDFIETELRPVDYTALKRADQEDKARLYDMGPGLRADVLWLNLSPGPKGSALRTYFLKDDFRLAISAAVNRREFCDAVYLGACDPVFGPVTPGNAAWFLPDLPAAGPDPELARAMLAGVGLQDRNSDGILDDESGHGIRLSVLISRSSAPAERGAAFVRDQLAKVGIRVEVTPVDAAVLADRRRSGNFDAILGRLDLRDSDPAMSPDFWIHPNAATDWERRINDLMLRQATSRDRVERVQLFAEVQKIYAQHMPEIYLGAPYTYVATNLHVLNAKPSRQRPALLWNADLLAITGR